MFDTRLVQLLVKLVQRVCVVLLLPVPVGVFGDVLVDLGRRLGEVDDASRGLPSYLLSRTSTNTSTSITTNTNTNTNTSTSTNTNTNTNIALFIGDHIAAVLGRVLGTLAVAVVVLTVVLGNKPLSTLCRGHIDPNTCDEDRVLLGTLPRCAWDEEEVYCAVTVTTSASMFSFPSLLLLGTVR